MHQRIDLKTFGGLAAMPLLSAAAALSMIRVVKVSEAMRWISDAL
jgi:hypothetical protein